MALPTLKLKHSVKRNTTVTEMRSPHSLRRLEERAGDVIGDRRFAKEAL
jgi:hypothetical protein